MIVDTPYCSAYLSINAIHPIHNSLTGRMPSLGTYNRERSRLVVPPAFGYRYLFSGSILHQEIPNILTPETSMQSYSHVSVTLRKSIRPW
jgi:hypothetical protein